MRITRTALARARDHVVAMLVMAASVTLTATIATAADGSVDRGEKLYDDCRNCHSIDRNGVGPMHKGVVGRMSGSVAGYDYSPALRAAKITWTEDKLNEWLQDPEKLVPGTKMFFAVDNPQDRADIIAFLKARAR